MVRVVLVGTLANRFTGGQTRLSVPARNVRELLRALDERYPGLADEIEQAQALAIDGEMYQEPFLQTLGENAEVYVLPKMTAG